MKSEGCQAAYFPTQSLPISKDEMERVKCLRANILAKGEV